MNRYLLNFHSGCSVFTEMYLTLLPRHRRLIPETFLLRMERPSQYTASWVLFYVTIVITMRRLRRWGQFINSPAYLSVGHDCCTMFARKNQKKTKQVPHHLLFVTSPYVLNVSSLLGFSSFVLLQMRELWWERRAAWASCSRAGRRTPSSQKRWDWGFKGGGLNPG